MPGKNIIFALPIQTFNRTRLLSTSCKCLAGFQGTKMNLPMEMKLRLIERKKRKIEKMAKQPLNHVPITDFFIPYSWKQPERRRSISELSDAEEDERVYLEKEWARFTNLEREREGRQLNLLMKSQETALNELKEESIELYNAAIQCDNASIPFTCRGPVQTLPFQTYLPPLGGFDYKEPLYSKDDLTLPDD